MERNAALTTRGRTPKVHSGLDSQLRPHNYRLLKSTEVQTRGGKVPLIQVFEYTQVPRRGHVFWKQMADARDASGGARRR
jgi:hypothetical protein